MPNALHQDFDRLRQVARLYNDGLFNSKRRLQAEQWQFDLKRKTLNHEVKVFNANAAKHPHAPVVKAVEQTGNKSASLMDSMWGACIVCVWYSLSFSDVEILAMNMRFGLEWLYEPMTIKDQSS
jgi:hypothetical protein